MKRNTLLKQYSPFYYTLTTVIGVFTGFLGSVYSSEITGAFPFYYGPYDGISTKAVAFWIAISGFSFLLFHQQKSISESRESEQEKLTYLIRTLPPEGFLTAFSETYKLCYEATRAVQRKGDSTKEDIEYGIRIILDGIIGLAGRFDKKESDVTYSANIMRFHPINSTGETTIAELAKNLLFANSDMDPTKLNGILEVKTSLSTTTATTEVVPDISLQYFTLPVAKTIYSGTGKYLVLPGAPLALAKQRMDAYADTSTLFEWCGKKGDFTESICQEIKDHFNGGGREIRSFISIPIIDNDSSPLGVLNIHSNRTGLLDSEKASAQFRPIIEPLTTMVIELITILAEKD